MSYSLVQLYHLVETTRKGLIDGLPSKQRQTLYEMLRGMSEDEFELLSHQHREAAQILCKHSFEQIYQLLPPHSYVPIEPHVVVELLAQFVPWEMVGDALIHYHFAIDHLSRAAAYLMPFDDVSELADPTAFLIDRVACASSAFSHIYYEPYDEWPYDDRNPFEAPPEPNRGGH